MFWSVIYVVFDAVDLFYDIDCTDTVVSIVSEVVGLCM